MLLQGPAFSFMPFKLAQYTADGKNLGLNRAQIFALVLFLTRAKQTFWPWCGDWKNRDILCVVTVHSSLLWTLTPSELTLGCRNVLLQLSVLKEKYATHLMLCPGLLTHDDKVVPFFSDGWLHLDVVCLISSDLERPQIFSHAPLLHCRKYDQCPIKSTLEKNTFKQSWPWVMTTKMRLTRTEVKKIQKFNIKTSSTHLRSISLLICSFITHLF